MSIYMKFEDPGATINSLRIKKNGKNEGQTRLAEIKVEGVVELGNWLDAILAQDINKEGPENSRAIDLFWLKDKESNPRFLGMKPIQTRTSFSDSTMDLADQELFGIISKVSFTPLKDLFCWVEATFTAFDLSSTQLGMISEMINEDCPCTLIQQDLIDNDAAV